MPNLVGPDTLDTVTSNPATNCLYPPKTLGGGIVTSSNIYVNKQPLRYAHAGQAPDPADGINILPSPPAPYNCQVPSTPRVLINRVNKSVFVNKVLPLVQGDLAQALSTDRPLVAPFQYPNLYVANKDLAKLPK